MDLATGRAKPVCSKRDQGANRAILEFITRETGPAQPINDPDVTFLSLQQVTVDRRALAQMIPLIPRSIGALMRLGVLSCHRFPRFADKLKIGLALQKIPMRGLPGRPRTLQGGLMRDPDPYDVDRLIQLFTKTSLKWPVVQEFDIDDEGKTYKEHQVDQVA
ncbi:hypothetical protein GQ600_13464 [Phytophthora cactorum]|nr:hypothetical protein GQ600_13464 [Phytophthora cactorum]